METLYNFVKNKKKSGRPVEYFFIEPVTGNKHIINNGLNTNIANLFSSKHFEHDIQFSSSIH